MINAVYKLYNKYTIVLNLSRGRILSWRASTRTVPAVPKNLNNCLKKFCQFGIRIKYILTIE